MLARLLQGIGGSSGMVIGRAMVLDRSSGTAAARALNVMMAMSGIAPIVAPLLGSLLAASIGWRGLLWIVCGVAVLALLASLAVLRETLPREVRAQRTAQRAARVTGADPHDGRAWLRPVVAGTVAFAFAMGVLMSYISASPFVYQRILGLGEVGYGLAFAVNAIGMMLATLISSRLTYRFSLRALAGAGLAISGAGVLLTLVLAVAGGADLSGWVMVALFLAIAPLGMVLGTVSALALSPVPPRSMGLASALMGLSQFVLAGLTAALVGLGGARSAVPMALLMLLCAVVSAAALASTGRAEAPAAREHALAEPA